MTLVHVLNGPHLRGAERFAVELAQALAERGIEQRLIVLRGLADEVPPLPRCSVQVSPSARIGLKQVWWLRKRLLGTGASTVLCHGQGPQKAVVLSLLGCGPRRPAVAVKQIGMLQHWIRSFVRPRLILNRWLMERCDLCVCLGPRQAKEVETMLQMPSCKIAQIPNGRRPPGDCGAGVIHDRLEILFVGALSVEKNPDVALDVFAEACKEVPGCRLTYAGDGPMLKPLQALSRDRFPEGAVRFLGRVPDIWPLYHGAGVVLLCSRTEGVPGVVVEATLAGVPTVAWDVGDIGQVLFDGANGRLTPYGDVAALALALREAIRSHEEWSRLRESTVATAASMSFDSIADAYIHALRLDERLKGRAPLSASPPNEGTRP